MWGQQFCSVLFPAQENLHDTGIAIGHECLVELRRQVRRFVYHRSAYT